MGPGAETPPGGPLAPGEATELLVRLKSGDADAEGKLYELLQRELKEVARAQLSAQSSDHTLQPTALVNEAWIRIAKAGGLQARDRKQFIAVAARAMRTVLIDHARRKDAAKRKGPGRRVELGVALDQRDDNALERTFALCAERGFDPIDLDDALERIAAEAPRQARLVELRFFGGLSREEAAEVLGVSRATVARDWEIVRHRLIWELGLDDEHSGVVGR